MSGTVSVPPPSVGSVDASIPLRAGQGVQQPNPLATIGQFANIQNAINQNKLFPLIQQQHQLGVQQQQQQLDLGAMQQLQTRLEYGGGQLASLLFNPDGTPTTGVSAKDIQTGLATAVGDKMLHYSDAAAVLSTLPNGGDDPVANRKWVVGHLISNQAARQRLGEAMSIFGQGPGTRENGLDILSGGVGGIGTTRPGGFTPQTQTPVYPSRAAQITQEPGVGPNFEPTRVPLGTRVGVEQGRPDLVGPPSGPLSTAFPGRNPPTAQPGAPSQSAAQPPPLPGGAVITGPPPGTPEFMQGSGMAAHTANQRAATFATDMFPLMQASNALEKAPTGKGSEAVHNVSSLLNTFAPEVIQKALSFVSPIMSKDEVSAYDEARKYLTQGTLGTAGATRSNEGLATAGAASPGVSISKEAAQVVLKGMIGLRRMEQQGTLEFNRSGQQPAAYDKYMSNFATKADPRAYTFDQISPSARAEMLKSMSPSARTKFWDQVHSAMQTGVLTPPNGQ